MDYCTLCRRHLNGALSCPGCGMPAEGSAPSPDDAAVEEVVPESGRSPSGGRRAARLAARKHRARGGRTRRGRGTRHARRTKGRILVIAMAFGVILAGLAVAEVATEDPFKTFGRDSASLPDSSDSDRTPGKADRSASATPTDRGVVAVSGAPESGSPSGGDGSGGTDTPSGSSGSSDGGRTTASASGVVSATPSPTRSSTAPASTSSAPTRRPTPTPDPRQSCTRSPGGCR